MYVKTKNKSGVTLLSQTETHTSSLVQSRFPWIVKDRCDRKIPPQYLFSAVRHEPLLIHRPQDPGAESAEMSLV